MSDALREEETLWHGKSSLAAGERPRREITLRSRLLSSRRDINFAARANPSTITQQGQIRLKLATDIIGRGQSHRNREREHTERHAQPSTQFQLWHLKGLRESASTLS